MKKILGLLFAFVVIALMTGCVKEIDYETHTVQIYFVSSRNEEDTLAAFSSLSDLILEALHDSGYPVEGIEFHVTVSLSIATQALKEGNADLVWMSAQEYVKLHDEESSAMDVILAASLDGLNKSSSNPADWNDGLPTVTSPSNQIAYGQSLILAGTSLRAQSLKTKVAQGEEITWDDLKTLSWCLKSASSLDGYLYPELWLMDNYSHSFEDISASGGSLTYVSYYGDSFIKLANGTCDVAATYADARISYSDEWTTEYGRTNPIWEETSVIGVSKHAMNSVFVVSTDYLRQKFIDALQSAILTVSQTDEGSVLHTWFAYDGFVIVQDSDFDSTRDFLEMMNQ